jgi:plastocyanin
MLVASLLALFVTGFVLSCQTQPPALTEPGQESPEDSLPEEPPEDTTPEAPPSEPSTVEVTIEGFAFTPATLNIPAGTRVTWSNSDSVPHTVTARDNLFDSGTFDYFCTIHPFMEGKIVVE